MVSTSAVFWPACSGPTIGGDKALGHLRRALWEINAALGAGWLVVERDVVGLSGTADSWLDVTAMRWAGGLARPQPPPGRAMCRAASLRFRKLLTCIKVTFLAGFNLRDSSAFDEWQFFEAEGVAAGGGRRPAKAGALTGCPRESG